MFILISVSLITANSVSLAFTAAETVREKGLQNGNRIWRAAGYCGAGGFASGTERPAAHSKEIRRDVSGRAQFSENELACAG